MQETEQQEQLLLSIMIIIQETEQMEQLLLSIMIIM
jgi:hypothetical protein